ncbi:hypothetical protein CHS0354_026478 [Potamilus streckersoni]|uniref:Uncharacterized protein n=1 Tax=Potamilus streckersoni TaxID=2493646 RepID=A0AAE0RQ23_9BIVA|nr:hypothetical protein CHS0354_026478 [Potamilus streckersoni]
MSYYGGGGGYSGNQNYAGQMYKGQGSQMPSQRAGTAFDKGNRSSQDNQNAGGGPGKRFFCDLCIVSFPSAEALEVHEKGLLHRSNKARMEHENEMERIGLGIQPMHQSFVQARGTGGNTAGKNQRFGGVMKNKGQGEGQGQSMSGGAQGNRKNLPQGMKQGNSQSWEAVGQTRQRNTANQSQKNQASMGEGNWNQKAQTSTWKPPPLPPRKIVDYEDVDDTSWMNESQSNLSDGNSMDRQDNSSAAQQGFCTYCNMEFRDQREYYRHAGSQHHKENVKEYQQMRMQQKNAPEPEKIQTSIPSLLDLPFRTPHNPEKAERTQNKQRAHQEKLNVLKGKWTRLNESEKQHLLAVPIEERDFTPSDFNSGQCPDLIDCKLCERRFIDANAFKTHLNSKAHRKNIKKASQGEKVPRSTSQIRNLLNFEYYSKEYSERPLLGLQYVTEFKDSRSEDEPNYVCNLCVICVRGKVIMTHLLGRQHLVQYLKIMHPDIHDMMIEKELRHDTTQIDHDTLEQICKEVEQTDGRAEVKVKDYSLEDEDGAEYMNQEEEEVIEIKEEPPISKRSRKSRFSDETEQHMESDPKDRWSIKQENKQMQMDRTPKMENRSSPQKSAVKRPSSDQTQEWPKNEKTDELLAARTAILNQIQNLTVKLGGGNQNRPDQGGQKQNGSEEELYPNSRGLYSICFPNRPDNKLNTEELVKRKFSWAGEVAEVKIIQKFIFVRFKDKVSAVRALQLFKNELAVQVADESRRAREDSHRAVQKADDKSSSHKEGKDKGRQRQSRFEEEIWPNSRGLYCLCFPNRPDNKLNTEELVRKKFSWAGVVAEVKIIPKFVFVRFQDKDSALKALQVFRNELYVQVADESKRPAEDYHRAVQKADDGRTSSKKDQGSQRSVSEEELWPNSRGLFCVMFTNRPNNKLNTEEQVKKKFSWTGEVVEVKMIASYVFVRYREKASALRALQIFKNELDVQVATESKKPKNAGQRVKEDQDGQSEVEDIWPSPHGLYSLCFPKTSHNKLNTKELVKKKFSLAGEVAEIKFIKEYTFVRFKNKASALQALKLFKKPLKLRVAHESRDKDASHMEGKKPDGSAAKKEPRNQVYIGNVPIEATKEDMEQLLFSFKPKKVMIIKKDDLRKYAFAEFEDERTARVCIEHMNTSLWKGRNLIFRFSDKALFDSSSKGYAAEDGGGKYSPDWSQLRKAHGEMETKQFGLGGSNLIPQESAIPMNRPDLGQIQNFMMPISAETLKPMMMFSADGALSQAQMLGAQLPVETVNPMMMFGTLSPEFNHAQNLAPSLPVMIGNAMGMEGVMLPPQSDPALVDIDTDNVEEIIASRNALLAQIQELEVKLHLEKQMMDEPPFKKLREDWDGRRSPGNWSPGRELSPGIGREFFQEPGRPFSPGLERRFSLDLERGLSPDRRGYSPEPMRPFSPEPMRPFSPELRRGFSPSQEIMFPHDQRMLSPGPDARGGLSPDARMRFSPNHRQEFSPGRRELSPGFNRRHSPNGQRERSPFRRRGYSPVERRRRSSDRRRQSLSPRRSGDWNRNRSRSPAGSPRYDVGPRVGGESPRHFNEPWHSPQPSHDLQQPRDDFGGPEDYREGPWKGPGFPHEELARERFLLEGPQRELFGQLIEQGQGNIRDLNPALMMSATQINSEQDAAAMLDLSQRLTQALVQYRLKGAGNMGASGQQQMNLQQIIQQMSAAGQVMPQVSTNQFLPQMMGLSSVQNMPGLMGIPQAAMMYQQQSFGQTVPQQQNVAMAAHMQPTPKPVPPPAQGSMSAQKKK